MARAGAVRGGRIVRSLARHEHLTAAGVVALVVLIYLWPALVGGDTLTPTALLYRLAPWQSDAPAAAAGRCSHAIHL